MKKSLRWMGILCLVVACTNPHSVDQTKIVPPSIQLTSPLDPICKMDVQVQRTDTILYQNKIYGFCSPLCKEHFKERIYKK